MRYVFILGRNPILSEAEILSCFERDGIKWMSHKLKSNALFVEIDRKIDLKKTMSFLGGTIAIGEVLFSGKKEEIIKMIMEKPIYFEKKNKLIYSALNYLDNENDFGLVLNSIKKNFANEGLKARYKGVSGTIKLQNGKIVGGSPEKISLRDKVYFIFSNEKEWNFGILKESYDYKEIEKRDMKKPYRREELAISPRLARIMINLAQIKENETLVDAFCGVGIILGEALLRGINVIGIDIDNSAIKKAKANIAWLKSNYKIKASDKLINDDSRNVRIEEFDAMVSEPFLGELLTKIPNEERAKQIIDRFEKLIISVLKNLKNKLRNKGKIVFSAPLIKIQKGRVGCNVGKIERETGLKLYAIENSCIKFPIKEFREEQIVGREIYVVSE
ncbi:MAG: DNA methyltransferase [Candidatus Pacearchaeota archaeon]|nr:DNA methyltransferase [Candidatus Pacearchaeota archaeon]